MRTKILFATAALSAAAYACSGVDPNSSLLGVEPDGGVDDAGGSKHDSGIRDSGIRDSAMSSDGSMIGSDSGIHDGGIITHPFGDGSVVPAVCGTQSNSDVVTCNSVTPTCCANQAATGTIFSCTAGAAACSGADTIPAQCRDDRDCSGGQVCCGDLPVTGSYTFLKCTDLAACPVVDDAGTLTDFARFCTPTDADPCATVGQTCMASNLLLGFNRCF